jgi:hypothetical protein
VGAGHDGGRARAAPGVGVVRPKREAAAKPSPRTNVRVRRGSKTGDEST